MQWRFPIYFRGQTRGQYYKTPCGGWECNFYIVTTIPYGDAHGHQEYNAFGEKTNATHRQEIFISFVAIGLLRGTQYGSD